MIKVAPILIAALSVVLAGSAYQLFIQNSNFDFISSEELILRKEFIEWMDEFKKQYSSPSEQEYRF